jgi:D-arabinan exo alpha-(1,3)/(1,5)-arabinofuranosidase (non-reducing end)
MLDNLARAREGCSKRISSWDRSGRNRDSWPVEVGETRVLAEMSGPGVIRHIWFTIASEDPLYLRKCVLRMYWDGQAHPSVETPVGDFFGVGHSKVTSYSCAVFNMSANPGNDRHAAMNCYFPMPYRSGARITVENQGKTVVRSFYSYVDYDELDHLDADQLRFHAWWRRENPCPPPAALQSEDGQVNLSDADNYLLLEAEGRGHFVGANLSVHNLLGGWWGEGDDMVMIDGQKWPPDLHGTGTEDWFNQAWGSQPKNAFPYNGVSYDNGLHNAYNERITVYRYHVADPILFQQSLRVSIEHGHANDRSDDYSSVAYWYQTLPSRPFPPLLPVEARLPRPDVTVQPVDLPLRPERRVSGSRFRPELG